MKNCDQFRELFGAYALGALDAKERAALEAHLAAGCKDCASQLADMAPEAAPSDMPKGRLTQIVRGEVQRTSPPLTCSRRRNSLLDVGGCRGAFGVDSLFDLELAAAGAENKGRQRARRRSPPTPP